MKYKSKEEYKQAINRMLSFDDEGQDTSTGFVGVSEKPEEYDDTVGKLFLGFLLKQPEEYISVSADSCNHYNHNTEELSKADKVSVFVQGYKDDVEYDKPFSLHGYVSICKDFIFHPETKDTGLHKFYDDFKDFVDNYLEDEKTYQEWLDDNMKIISENWETYDEYYEEEIPIPEERDVDHYIVHYIFDYLKDMLRDFENKYDDILERYGYY